MAYPPAGGDRNFYKHLAATKPLLQLRQYQYCMKVPSLSLCLPFLWV
ncbi:hypothetical protein [Nostoc sp. NIES-3756]|nr:hypothetical protein [Nostoc sp. NIES-3756]